jgi:acyl carrier protein
MNIEQAALLVREAISEVAPTRSGDFATVDLDTKIRDMGIDSVAAMEMVGVVEERLEITFPDEDLAQLNRFSDLVDLIVNNA